MSKFDDEEKTTNDKLENCIDINLVVELSKTAKFKEFMYGFLSFGAINAVILLLFRLLMGKEDIYGLIWISVIILSSIPLFIINIWGIFYFSKRRKYFMFGIFPMLLYSMFALYGWGSYLFGWGF